MKRDLRRTISIATIALAVVALVPFVLVVVTMAQGRWDDVPGWSVLLWPGLPLFTLFVAAGYAIASLRASDAAASRRYSRINNWILLALIVVVSGSSAIITALR
ncbi:hypothetical protein [Asanoa ishikariensis]|nr:hypothetical protein [Asanoa ishikariensis]